jgi:tRNA 2-thiouridine synthesizing protein A
MLETPVATPTTRIVDARGSYCPGPLMELIGAIREGQGSRTDIPKWVEKAGHGLIAIADRDGYDEIIVEKRR